jgi:hypothetical protein
MLFPIEASAELVAFCTDWHGGQWSSMYSVSSTGAIHSAEYLRGLASELRAIRRDLQNRASYSRVLKQVAKLLANAEALEDALPDED